MSKVQKGLALFGVAVLGCAVIVVAGLGRQHEWPMPLTPPEFLQQTWLVVGVAGVGLVALSFVFFWVEVAIGGIRSKDRREFDAAYREWERQQSPVPFPIWYNTADKTVEGQR